MSTCFSKEFFQCLSDISQNNNSPWYHQNKERINFARKEMENFANILIPEVRGFDENVGLYDAKQTMYKQHRDIRFSKDKSPLKTYISSVIFNGNSKANVLPCYYLHLEKDYCMISGGVYSPEKDNLKKIRDEIFYNIDEFKSIINHKHFKKYFDTINSEDRLKTAPKGFPKDWPDIEIIKNKNFTPSHFCSIEKAQDKDFINYVIDAYKSLADLNKFFFKAMN